MSQDRRARQVQDVSSRLCCLTEAGLEPLADAIGALADEPFGEMARALLGHGQSPPAQLPHELALETQARASGAGFRIWTPAGTLVRGLVEDWMRQVARTQLGGQELQTPCLYHWGGEERLHDLAESFEDRLFVSRQDDHAHVLRYGADPGFFDYASSLRLRQEDLPVRMWEYGPAWRRSRSGELRGIERLNEFYLLDHHTICCSSEAIAEYERLLTAQIREIERVVGPVGVHFTATEATVDAYIPMMQRIADRLDTPVIVEVISRASHYWSLKSFVFVGGPFTMCNLQLDDENPTRFGLLRGPGEASVIHCTLSTVERMLLVLTHRAHELETPVLPLWLAPTQIRLIPPDPKTDVSKLVAQFRAHDIRIEIDDRRKSVGWRINSARQSWVPAVVLPVNDPHSDEVVLTWFDGRRVAGAAAEVAAEVAGLLAGYPRRALTHTHTRDRYWVR